MNVIIDTKNIRINFANFGEIISFRNKLRFSVVRDKIVDDERKE